jgi:hypothetical protein
MRRPIHETCLVSWLSDHPPGTRQSGACRPYLHYATDAAMCKNVYGAKSLESYSNSPSGRAACGYLIGWFETREPGTGSALSAMFAGLLRLSTSGRRDANLARGGRTIGTDVILRRPGAPAFSAKTRCRLYQTFGIGSGSLPSLRQQNGDRIAARRRLNLERRPRCSRSRSH